MDNPDCLHLPYSSTGFFSKLVIDYLQQVETLKPFYKYSTNQADILKAIKEREQHHYPRNILVEALQKQYQNIELTKAQQQNIEKLSQPNCFTVTTAHQPNIFTGPLYFIYKIAHAIALASELNNNYTNNHFVPVYYMGSEDADLDELGNFTIQQTKRTWNTKQTGAVGRMLVDDAFLQLLHQIKGQLNVLPHGEELTQLFANCYTKGTSIQQATLQLGNALFADYGLLIIIPDNATLKQCFKDVVLKELSTQFSHSLVQQTNEHLAQHYKTQASGRDVNLFYLVDDKRERIEKQNELFTVHNTNISFTKEQIEAEVTQHPERFSANVILRPVFQETILPNLFFVGGGGELAYWMQLKEVFNATQTPYPILVLRNSFLLLNKREQKQLKDLGLYSSELFKAKDVLVNEHVRTNSSNNLSLQQSLDSFKKIYENLQQQAKQIDVSLLPHVQKLQQQNLYKLHQLEKKLLKAEKKKFSTQQQQITHLKETLFPKNNLQERVENFSFYYASFGKQFIEMIVNNSLGLGQEFVVVTV